MLSNINAGDTAWMLMCAALAFLAIPGFAFFYGGLSPKKNPFLLFLPCVVAAALVSFQWIVVGYSLSFGPDHNGWIGTLAHVGLRGIDAEPNLEYAGTIPPFAFVLYHAMLAAAAGVILLSVFAERMKLMTLCLFAVLWTTLVYDPIAHWIWNVDGFLRRAGVIDFAGGTVIHVNAGISALAATLVFGKSTKGSEQRTEKSEQPTADLSSLFALRCSLPLGAVCLWLGWFGLNGGSALSAGAVAANAVLATMAASIAGGLTWTLLDGIVNRKPTLLSFITGTIVGLVAISAGAGTTGAVGALGIGFGASVLCYAALLLIEKKTGAGDTFLIFCIHGIGGIWGMICAGQLLIQLKAVLAIAIYSFGMTYILLKLLDILVGLRSANNVGLSET